nr:immunoglobulin heavy chain junction region [Macaca mulatta]MOV53252.1 immunoglobulin heavy chain junction region [Macaca mulatta]MOV53339.1 immunoglobulin heavy chain junction region [Macaca mulatta]MOV53487.1 immunoglobulin heavy chain junction region [Macaca mulatta]MOV53584.1 immunoglobulin heavy chain junction region [Macaca mulatta]
CARGVTVWGDSLDVW